MPNKYIGQTGTPANANLDTLPQMPGVLGALPAAVVAALQQFSIMAVVANAAARDALIPAPYLHQRVLNLATSRIERWTGAAWVQDVPLPAAKEADAIPAVLDVPNRGTVYPAPSSGQRVYNKAARRFERFISQGITSEWFADSETPSQRINPKSFALANWYDANGMLTVGAGRVDYITPAEAALTHWRGKYFAWQDTRDYVCLQEALYEAFAPASSQGNIIWNESGAESNAHVDIPPGVFSVNRPLWTAFLQGGLVTGHTRFSTIIQGISKDTRVLWTDGMTGCSFRNITFQRKNLRATDTPYNSFWHPVLDTDFYGGGIVGGAVARAGDLTQRTVVSSQMPSMKRVGTGRPINADVDKLLIIVDDATTPTAIGQVMRIVENTADEWFLAGKWAILPSANAKFVVGADVYGCATYHGHNWLTDWVHANNPSRGDFITIASVDGKTLRRFPLTGADGVDGNGPQVLQTQTILSHTKHKLTLTADWGTGIPVPNGTSSADNSALGPFGNAQPNAPFGPLANYCIGGTFYDNGGGANAITTTNENSVTLDGNYYGVNDQVGAYMQVVSSAQGFTGAPTAVAGALITQAGAARVAGDDVSKLLVPTSGAAVGQSRIIRANTGTTWTLDAAFDQPFLPGDTFEIVDPARGQILIIAQNASNKITTTWNGVDQYYLFTKRPKAGDKVNILPRATGGVFTGNHFLNCVATTGDWGDCAWAWARSGDQSMGSEAVFIDCTISGTVGFYSNGLNALNLSWYGGQTGCTSHTFYCQRGWMSHYGVGFGGVGTDKKHGYEIWLGPAATGGSRCRSCYTENLNLIKSAQPLSVEGGVVAGGIGGANPGAGGGAPTLAHVWTEGEFMGMPYDRNAGRQFRCVEVFGTADTTAAAFPATAPCDGHDMRLTIVDGGGNGARFVRLDYVAMELNVTSRVIGGTYALGVLQLNKGGTYNSVTVSRPDAIRSIFTHTDTGQGASVVGPRLAYYIVDGGAPANTFFPLNLFTDSPFANNPDRLNEISFNMFDGALLLGAGRNGADWQYGWKPYDYTELGDASVPNPQWLLATVDGGNEQRYHGNQNNPMVEGKPPRTGADLPGFEKILAGGQATGSGAGGGIRFRTGLSGGAAGATRRGWGDAMLLDGLQRQQRFAGCVKKAVAGVIDIGAGGTATPNPTVVEVSRYRLAGAATFLDPVGTPIDGQSWTLEIFNNTGAPVTPVAGGTPTILGGFVAIGAGKWQTRRYIYDATIAKWKPTGAWSGDL